VLTIQLGINRPRYASLRGIRQAAAQPIETLTHSDLGVSDASVGEAGALSHVRRMYVPAKGKAELITGSPAQQAAKIVDIIKQVRGL
jgi:electron transfer flavoprotein beta subunit